jgi:hypothetical protein
MREMRNLYIIKVKKHERMLWHRWKDNIKMDLWKLGGIVCTGFIWLRKGTSGRVL